MVDRNPEIDYNNGVEVNSGNGLGIFHLPPFLSHFCQLNTFGGRTPGFTFNTTGIPLVPLLASTTESGVKSGAFSFLPKNEMTPGARDTQGQHEQTDKEPAVRQDCTESSRGTQIPPTSLDSLPLSIQIDLTQRNINNLMAAILSQMATLADMMREIATLKGGQ